MKNGRIFAPLSTSIIIIILLQIALGVGNGIFSRMVPDSRFAGQMLTMCLMLVLTVVLVFYVVVFKQKISFFPVKFSKGYIIATCLVGILYITAPANYIDGFPAIMVLIYSSIVTPIYEELLFRGIIWSLFEESTSNQVTVFAWNVVLFTIWHIGYMVPNILSGNWNAVIWKLAAGLGYGVVLSLLRLKTKNCYATVLAHGVLNLFMI